MATPDLEVIKEIPGYKVILKAVLKAQIQQLVEQLADHTDEESVILTASVSDGTLCHLGSESGKVFLEDHDDIKSQFLGFCLKRHHRKKQKEKEEAAQRSAPPPPTTPTRLGSGYGPRPRIGTSPRQQFSPTRFQTSPRHNFPQGQSPHPISLTRVSHGGPMRSSPYPANRPIRRPNFDQGSGGPRPARPMRLPVASDNGKVEKKNVIKIELNDDDPDTDRAKTKTETEGSGESTSSQSQSSTSQITPSTPQPSESTHDDDITEPKSDSSSSTIPHEPSELTLAEGLSLDSDLSNLISDAAKPTLDMNITPATPQSGGSGSAPPTPGASNVDPNVNVKVEAITESEMDLEITGVEPGWAPNVQGGMGGYDPTSGASGNQGDMPGDQSEQGYSVSTLPTNQSGFISGLYPSLSTDNYLGESAPISYMTSASTDQHVEMPSARDRPRVTCADCGMSFAYKSQLELHYRKHTGVKPFECNVCHKTFARKDNLKIHMFNVHFSK